MFSASMTGDSSLRPRLVPSPRSGAANRNHRVLPVLGQRAHPAPDGGARNGYHGAMSSLPPFRVNEIFLSVQGEGLHVGERTAFVRFYGCPLRCKWCDQPEALAHTGVGRFATMSAEEVREQVGRFPDVRRLCLTGGEPVIAPKASLLWLLEDRRRAGWWSSIETSGARVVEELFEAIDFWTVAPKGRSAETFDGDPVATQLPTLRRYAALPEGRRQF